MTTNLTYLLCQYEAAGWTDDQFDGLLAHWNWNEPIVEVELWRDGRERHGQMTLRPALWAILQTKSPRLIERYLTPDRQGHRWDGSNPPWKTLFFEAVRQGQLGAVEQLMAWPEGKDASHILLDDNLWKCWAHAPANQVTLLRLMEPALRPYAQGTSTPRQENQLRQMLRLKIAKVWLSDSKADIPIDTWQQCFPKWSKEHQAGLVDHALLHGRSQVALLYADEASLMSRMQALMETKDSREIMRRTCDTDTDARWVAWWVESARRQAPCASHLRSVYDEALERLAVSRPDDPQWPLLAPASAVPSVDEWIAHGHAPQGEGYRTRLSQGHVLSARTAEAVLTGHSRVLGSTRDRVPSFWARVRPGFDAGLFRQEVLEEFVSTWPHEQRTEWEGILLDHALPAASPSSKPASKMRL